MDPCTSDRSCMCLQAEVSITFPIASGSGMQLHMLVYRILVVSDWASESHCNAPVATHIVDRYMLQRDNGKHV